MCVFSLLIQASSFVFLLMSSASKINIVFVGCTDYCIIWFRYILKSVKKNTETTAT